MRRKIGQHVAGWQSHFLEVCRVPGGKNDTAIVGVVLELVHDFSELIDTLTSVVGLCILVFGTKMAPLETIDGTEVTNFTV